MTIHHQCHRAEVLNLEVTAGLGPRGSSAAVFIGSVHLPKKSVRSSWGPRDLGKLEERCCGAPAVWQEAMAAALRFVPRSR